LAKYNSTSLRCSHANSYISRAQAVTLNFILAQNPHLKNLYFKYWPWSDAEEHLDCAKLRHALESVSHKLTELIILFLPFTTQAEDIEEGMPGVKIHGA
jgi:hypothetical protein